jgi:DNA polymerase-3 subunit alpha
MGLFLSEHPLHRMAGDLDRIATTRCGEIDASMKGQVVTVAGMVSSVRRITTRKGDPMAFARIEDLQGSVEVTVFPRVWQATSELWQEDNLIVVRGRVEQRDDRVQIICNEAWRYQPDEGPPTADRRPQPTDHAPSAVAQSAEEPSFHLVITIQRTGDQEADIRHIGQVYDLLTGYEGNDRFSLIVVNGDSGVRLDFPNDTTRYCVSLLENLRALVGESAIRVETVNSGQ